MADIIRKKHFSLELKMQIIKEWESGIPMSQLVLKYDLYGVRIIKRWLAWYRANGVPKRVIEENRGRHKNKNETIEQKVKRLEMENDLLKKFHELLKEEHKRK